MKKTYDFGYTAFLMGGESFVVLSDTKDMIGGKDIPTKEINITGRNKSVAFVKRGDNNKLSVEIMDKIFANSHLGANIGFNAKLAYGDGIMVLKRERDEKGEIKLKELLPSEVPDIYDFIIKNNYVNCVQEWANDISVFYESFVEFIYNKEGNKIVRLNSVETSNSRLSVANDNGIVEWHGYSTQWKEGTPEDVTITPLLDRKRPILALTEKRKKKGSSKENKYMLQLMLPTPGNYYYGKPYWWAIFESGWYDFACAIPKFKQALMKNQMTLRYHVTISNDFWTKLFNSEGIPKDDDKKKKARKKKFLEDLNNFLAGEENAGKSFVSHFAYDQTKGFEKHDIVIKPINAKIEGGEYLEDSEEVTNVLCYAMDIHPSLIGATGKKGGINGTETRELFIMKQALMKPIRDLLVLPLYLVKHINGWDKDIEFAIPNIMLTTLDKNTGAIKSVGNQKV